MQFLKISQCSSKGFWGLWLASVPKCLSQNSSWVAVHFVFVNMLAKLAAPNIKYISQQCAALHLMCCCAIPPMRVNPRKPTHSSYVHILVGHFLMEWNWYCLLWKSSKIVWDASESRREKRWKKAGMMGREAEGAAAGVKSCERSDGRRDKQEGRDEERSTADGEVWRDGRGWNVRGEEV